VFCPNCKRKRLSEPELLSLILYIHRNPVHHGFCASLDDWYWSSYHTYLNQKQTLLPRDEVLQLFDGREIFESLHWESADYTAIVA
jgi:hypothetical protein